MPLLAFGLGTLFGLDTALLAGVILVGACPGGTASNVITYLSGGDVALSVGMTSVNTVLAPVFTLAITYLFLHKSVEVDAVSMFVSIIQVVIIPVVIGSVRSMIFVKLISISFSFSGPSHGGPHMNDLPFIISQNTLFAHHISR